ncbi:hypothetical protein Prudu_658S000300 [Prunus dulcis]|uniref:Myb/SANT-like domain-containing protein n=1 Tax=Prunus dulcis TaxID=3755 RepID=A0A5H2XQ74_PRUDU|nr:hypothetical protein Prudu_658S000300 [Prunus dulcis]
MIVIITYTNGTGFLAPFRGQCYHLIDWRDGHRTETPKECFNMKHSSARNVIESRSFIVMGSTATSSGKVKGGRGQNKHCWTTKEDNTLMECLMELHQNTNWRGDTGFKNGYLNKLETILEVKLPNSGLKASPHIESRVKTLKGKYGALANALSQCGFGWNEEEMITKRCKWFVCKSFPHYYPLGEIYGKERAIGTNAGNVDDDEEDVR